jgi:hypothetical protein
VADVPSGLSFTAPQETGIIRTMFKYFLTMFVYLIVFYLQSFPRTFAKFPRSKQSRFHVIYAVRRKD